MTAWFERLSNSEILELKATMPLKIQAISKDQLVSLIGISSNIIL